MNPYHVLGVDINATEDQIKSAYRKLALRHHPDKVRGDEGAKLAATQKFAEIGAAYEMLTEERNRMEAAQRETDEMNRRQARRQGSDPNFGFSQRPFMDPFFHAHARDPFQLFEEMFRGSHGSSRNRHDPFDDPFFQSAHHNHSGFGDASAFGMMNQMMSDVHRRHQQHQHQHSHRSIFDSMRSGDPFAEMEQMHMGGGSGSGFAGSSFSSSSSTSYFGGEAPGERVTKTTRVVNGKRQTQIERTIVHPDGREETTVEVEGDDDFPQHAALSNDNQRRGLISRGRPPQP